MLEIEVPKLMHAMHWQLKISETVEQSGWTFEVGDVENRWAPELSAGSVLS